MKLASYLTRERLSYAEFARRIGTPHARTVERYAKSIQRPNGRMMSEIVRETRGEVTANDFFDFGPTVAPNDAEQAHVSPRA